MIVVEKHIVTHSLEFQQAASFGLQTVSVSTIRIRQVIDWQLFKALNKIWNSEYICAYLESILSEIKIFTSVHLLSITTTTTTSSFKAIQQISQRCSAHHQLTLLSTSN